MSLSASRLCQEILKLFSSLFPSLFHAHSSTLADSLFLRRRRAVDKLLFCSHASWCRGAVSAAETTRELGATSGSSVFPFVLLPLSSPLSFSTFQSQALTWRFSVQPQKTRISDWIEKEETRCDLCLERHPGSNLSR